MSYEAQIATDTLSVAWLRGVFRHDARASQAAFRDYVSCLDDVYADERASGVPPPVHESSHGKCSHTPAAHRLSGCASCYTLKGYGGELTHIGFFGTFSGTSKKCEPPAAPQMVPLGSPSAQA